MKNEAEVTTKFYDDMAPLYHLVYENWDASIVRQANMLESVFKERWSDAIDLLDVSCGIGTQTLGLAAKGYRITASDLAPGAVGRAREEALSRGLDIQFSVADMRVAFDHHGKQFDLILAGDNAIPHLLTDSEILDAFRQFYLCTREGGGCVISVRDYAVEHPAEEEGISFYGTRLDKGITYLVFRKREWDGQVYLLSMYFVADDGSAQCTTHVMRSHYYAIGIERLCELMHQAGFTDVERVDGRFFQPLIVGTRKS